MSLEMPPPQDPEIREVLEEILAEYNKTRDRIHSAMSKSGWCLAASEAVTLLKKLTLHHPHSVVLSREDVIPGFWNSKRASEFIAHLRSPANVSIVQTRVKVFPSDFDPNEKPSPEELWLQEQHEQIMGNRGGLYYVESKDLEQPDYTNLFKARYGLTVFQKEPYPKFDPRFVAVPFPALTLYNIAKCSDNPLDMLVEAGKYDPISDMQMVIIVDKKFVHEIAAELFHLITHRSKSWSFRGKRG